MTKSRIHLAPLACAAALAFASAATPATADNPPPGLLAKIQIATAAPTGPGDALSDLPSSPKVQPGPPELTTARPGFQNKALGGPDTKSLGGPDTKPGSLRGYDKSHRLARQAGK